MKIKVKPFKTWQQQVEILNEYGNNFLHKNPGDLSDVLDYLMTNCFQVGIDAFAPFLWKNFNDGISKVDLKFTQIASSSATLVFFENYPRNRS